MKKIIALLSCLGSFAVPLVAGIDSLANEKLNLLSRAIVGDRYTLGMYERFHSSIYIDEKGEVKHRRDTSKAREILRKQREQSIQPDHSRAYSMFFLLLLQPIKGECPEVLFYQVNRSFYGLAHLKPGQRYNITEESSWLLVLESPYDDQGQLVPGRYFDYHPDLAKEPFYGPHNFFNIKDDGIGAFCIHWTGPPYALSNTKPEIVFGEGFLDDVKALVALWEERTNLATDPAALEAKINSVLSGLQTDYGRQLAERVLAIGWPEVESVRSLLNGLLKGKQNE